MNILIVTTLSAILAVTSAMIVCPPNFCDDVKQELLDCAGGVLKNSGTCGCTDSCAKVEGEQCYAGVPFLGVSNTNVCDDGLVCMPDSNGSFSGTCIKLSSSLLIKREVPKCQTACQRKSLQCTFSMVVYEGQWFAKCDLQGNFLTEQCDNTNHCFCVDHETGEVMEGTKQLGSANC